MKQLLTGTAIVVVIALGVSLRTNAQNKPPVPKWEYTVVWMAEGAVTTNGGVPSETAALNKAGDAGWELVSQARRPVTVQGTSRTIEVFYLRRQK